MNIEHVATLYLEDSQKNKIINETKTFFSEWDYPFPSNRNTDKPSNLCIKYLYF